MKGRTLRVHLVHWRPSFMEVGELTKKYSNLPDSYIKRSMEQVFYRTPRTPNYLRRTVKKCHIEFTMNRPWTFQSVMNNPTQKTPRLIFVEPIKDWLIFKGDRVEILVGSDKGKQGVVSQVFQERNWVTIHGLNMKVKVLEKEGETPALIEREEQPLRVTDQVALVDPSDLLPCKAVWRYTEEGERVRVSVKSGRIIPMPIMAEETYDYKTPNAYNENPKKDTPKAIVEKITFKPTLQTFEMDIMEKQGIKEDRIPAPVYWY